MPQRKISQDWLCPLYSGKREWLRYRRAYCGGAFVWVRTARAEETLIKLLLSAKHEEVCKRRSIKGKAIKGNHREQAHIQKITSQQGLLLGNPWAIQEKESFCHVMARVAAETGLAQHCWIRRFLSEQNLESWNAVSLSWTTAVQRSWTLWKKKGQSQSAGSICPVVDVQFCLKRFVNWFLCKSAAPSTSRCCSLPSSPVGTALPTRFDFLCSVLHSMDLANVAKELQRDKTVPSTIELQWCFLMKRCL